MIKYRPKLYISPLRLPAGRSGKVEVRHNIAKKGTSLPVIGIRQGFVRGITPVMAKMQEDRIVHELHSDGQGMWMTDLPEELNQIGELIHTVAPHGRVLVGGLGLGILANVLADSCDVTTVEINKDIIKLCARPGYRTIHGDIKQYLEETKEEYDFYLLDTWQLTNEGTWWSTVMPLRRIIRNRWGRTPVIHCWAEDIMRGQVERTLQGQPHWYYEGIAPLNPVDARSFTRNVGTPRWEKRWGAIVDNNIQRRREPKKMTPEEIMESEKSYGPNA